MMRGVNLIPSDRRLTQQRRRRLHRWIGVAVVQIGLVVAACVGAHVAWDRGNSAVAGELSQTQQHISEIKSGLADVKRLLAEAELSQKAVQAVSDQPDWSILLSILGGAVGDDVVLREIQLRPDASPSRQFSLQLRGVTRFQTGVSQFVLRLGEVGLFDEVKLLRTGREPVLGASAVTFEVSCLIREGGRQHP